MGAKRTIHRQIEYSVDDGCWDDFHELDLLLGKGLDGWIYVGDDWATDPRYKDQNIVLRWREVSIPQGASITSATLTVYADDGVGAREDPTYTRIKGVAHDNCPLLTTKEALLAHGQTTNYVDWTIVNVDGEWTSAPDLKTVVQELVDRAGWMSDALALILFDNKWDHPDIRLVEKMISSWDRDPAYAPRLEISYEADLGPHDLTKVTARPTHRVRIYHLS